jgi:hypothetical protein
MKIHHVIVETLKKVELVSTAKIMDILLVGALKKRVAQYEKKAQQRQNKQINAQETIRPN